MVRVCFYRRCFYPIDLNKRIIELVIGLMILLVICGFRCTNAYFEAIALAIFDVPFFLVN